MDTVDGQKQAVLQFKEAFEKQPRISISKMQIFARRERSVKPSVVVSKTVISPSEEFAELLCAELWEVMQSKAEGTEKMNKPSPCIEYQGEWMGIASGHNMATSTVTSSESFDLINENVSTDLTMYYLAGGGLFTSGIPGSRSIISQLCRHNGARAFTMQHRLTPQETVPTLLLDVLVGYFFLISPPSGSMHQPVDPKKLVLVGESGGANLHLGIIQFIKYLRERSVRQGVDHPTMRINDRDVPVEMPAGCALLSPACDLPLALPAAQRYKFSDWLSTNPSWLEQNFPSDAIWPAKPPRSTLQADTSCICHPIYQPSCCVDWSGAPPVWLACGQEVYSDGIRFLAQNMIKSGVSTQFMEYEFMPHSWPIVLHSLPQSRHCTKLWGEACRTMVESKYPWKSSCCMIKLGQLEMVEISGELLKIPKDEVLRMMKAKRDSIAKYVWKGSTIGLVKL